MRIEKITENKIRITLNMQDLQEKNIDLHTFMSNSLETQDLFYDMLDEAEKEVGFETKDYKLMIEALAVPNGNFVLTVTRIIPEKEAPKKKLTAKRKANVIPTNLSIYMFNTFEDYLEFCHSIINNSENTYSFLKKSNLYSYKSKYYLCLNVNNKDMNLFKNVHYKIKIGRAHV